MRCHRQTLHPWSQPGGFGFRRNFASRARKSRISRIGDRVILEPIGELRPMPWDQIDRLGDTSFMSKGRDQLAMPADRVVLDE